MDAQAMTSFDLAQTGLLAVRAAGWAAAGVLIGALHFSTLRWNVNMLALGRTRLMPLGFQFGRAALLAGILATIVGFGALPLLLVTGGILIARWAIIRSGERK
jgi:hypothetical protein